MIYIGIDPGQKGGIAVINSKREILALDRYDDCVMRYFSNLYKDGLCHWWVEKVHAMPKQGVKSTFSFGVSFGKILGFILANHTFYSTVTPQVWKKELGVTRDKRTSIAKAEELFPNVELIPENCRVKHDGMAEALLIAEYGRRRHEEDTNIIC